MNTQIMETQQQVDYDRIASAIRFFKDNFKTQPGLEEAARRRNNSCNT
jgi:AraC family transcriptional regulator of adaptative response/methylated-DNA-[protein]-cysteine methyltransferase